MGFPKAIYDKAFEEKRVVRQRNEALREEKKAQLYKDFPRVKEIDTELSKMGIELTMAAFSGKKDLLKQLENKAQRLETEKSTYIGTDFHIAYECEKCQDSGYVNGKICECIVNSAKKLQFSELSSAAPFKECTFENFNTNYYPETGAGKISPKLRMEKNLSYAKKFADKFPNGENLLFTGGTGLGKTHLSLAIGNAVTEKGYSVFYCSSEYIVTKSVNEKFGKSDGEMPYYNSVRDCDLFILDDLGTEIPTQMVPNTIYDIINSRILTGKSTLINTNLSMEEIAKKYTPRVSSRLIGEYTTLLFEGSDIRQIKKMQK